VAIATIPVLRAMGINDITLLGRYEPKLAVARAMGAARTIKATKNRAGINELTEADWTANGTATGVFDLAISCVGGAAEPLVDLVPRMERNGRIVHLGVTHGLQSVDLSQVFHKELRIIGSNCYSYRGQQKESALALELMRRRPEVFRRLFTHRVPLEKINEGLEMMLYSERDRVVKILVEP
jgi:threonine dehydrogenase-like Zn-dependent dehydrogenase